MMPYTIIEIITFAGVLVLLFYVTQLISQMKSMKHSLDQITKKLILNDETVSNDAINNELRKLLLEGHDVKAVKLARESFGMSLLEAKQYIDALKLENK
ncbi:hypothetical protein ACFSTH_00815 [Paenibacillus yanchengensis]|uniref:Ribosomal protein L7/L12 C-terminal domain-containing protein n=1 Tax=Paenibacillus yanchengensis TaxID=2035833 RepID=A0ABW4YFG5_9BACL